jgi:hypothetical protein
VNDRDIVGELGEAICRAQFMRMHPTRGYLFEPPCFLGGKKRSLDFYVELIHDDSLVPFFFIQVKATDAGRTSRGNRLKVKISGTDWQRLAGYHVPTYLVGVDTATGKAYLLSANGESRNGWSSMTTEHLVTPESLALLWDEVEQFWQRPDYTIFRSGFCDSTWGTI